MKLIFIGILGTTLYNKETGYLSRENKDSGWKSNNHSVKERIPNDNLDVPTRSPEKSKRVRSDNKYIEFTPTDVVKDIAQTTGELIEKTHLTRKRKRIFIFKSILFL